MIAGTAARQVATLAGLGVVAGGALGGIVSMAEHNTRDNMNPVGSVDSVGRMTNKEVISTGFAAAMASALAVAVGELGSASTTIKGQAGAALLGATVGVTAGLTEALLT